MHAVHKNNMNLSEIWSKHAMHSGKIRSTYNTFNNIQTSHNGIQFFNNYFANDKSTFKLLSNLTDDILNDILEEIKFPKSNSMSLTEVVNCGLPSLYQIYQILEPSFDKIATERKLNIRHSENDSYNNTKSSSSLYFKEVELSDKLNIENINRSYSMKFLNEASKEVLEQLSLYKLQKTSVKSEIKDIEAKLLQLTQMKESLLERLGCIDQNEIKVKDRALAIKIRKDFVNEYGLVNKEEIRNTSNNDDYEEDEDDILNKYLTESNSFLEEYELNSTSNSNSLPSISNSNLPSLPSMFIPENASDTATTVEELSKFYEGPHRKQKYVSVSLQELYQPGSVVANFNKVHDDGITCLDFDFPFGTMITAGFMDHSIKIWDLSGRKQIGQLDGHHASITCMQMDPNFNLAVSGSKDATLKLWNIDLATESNQEVVEKFNDQLCLHSFASHKGEITALSLSNENMVSGSNDKTVRQWDLKTGKCIQPLDIAFAMRNGNLQVESTNFSILQQPVIGALQVFETALATGTKDGIIRLWDLRAGKVVRSLEGHQDSITSLKFDSTNMITGSQDCTVRIWDLRTGGTIESLKHNLPVIQIQMDQERIITSTIEDCAVFDKTTKNKHIVNSVNDYSAEITAMQYKDGHLIVGNNNGDIHVLTV